MKTLKLFTAGLLALVVAASASAQTHVYITGSSAFRKATHAAIINILGNSNVNAAFTGTAAASATRAVFTGTLSTGPSAGQQVVFHTFWAGSTGGIQTVAQQSPVINQSWLNETTTTPVSITLSGTAASYTFNGGTSGVATNGTTTISSPADVAMSDTFQGSSIFTGANYHTLTSQVVGVIVFRWIRGNATTTDGTTTASSNFSNVTNITTLQAQNLLNGGLPLSQFTGVSGDSAAGVYVLGRDEDSGTRLVTFAEPGFGVQSTPLQYQTTVGSGTLSGVVTALNPFPAATILGFSYPAGHSGYASGGTLTTELNRMLATSLGSFLIGYAGRNDAAAVTNGASLTYNGVDDTDANVRTGKYTFWSYQHLLYKSTFSGVGKNASDALATQIKNTDSAASGVVLSTMEVGRAVEGGAVTFGNPY